MKSKSFKTLAILASCFLYGCSYSVLIDMPVTRSTDTCDYKPNPKQMEEDTLELSDIPIDFDVNVEDWKE